MSPLGHSVCQGKTQDEIMREQDELMKKKFGGLAAKGSKPGIARVVCPDLLLSTALFGYM